MLVYITCGTWSCLFIFILKYKIDKKNYCKAKKRVAVFFDKDYGKNDLLKKMSKQENLEKAQDKQDKYYESKDIAKSLAFLFLYISLYSTYLLLK